MGAVLNLASEASSLVTGNGDAGGWRLDRRLIARRRKITSADVAALQGRVPVRREPRLTPGGSASPRTVQ